MPTVREIEQALYNWAPKETAFPWDNVGQLLGDPNRKVERVLVALDITDAVAEEAIAKKCELIVAHHPVMNCKWLPVQTVRTDTPQGNLLLKILLNGVNAVCMHTNLDLAAGGVNDALAERLELLDAAPFEADGLCRAGFLKRPMALQDFAAFVSEKLGCNGLRYADAGKTVSKVAVGGGACSEYDAAAIAAGCDTFVTSDVTYHQFLDAKGKGINLIDAGHFPTEDPVCDKLIKYISEQFPELTVTKSDSHREVIQYYV
jgi:dinuclear metal center YbgI/SA1388 family protein